MLLYEENILGIQRASSLVVLSKKKKDLPPLRSCKVWPLEAARSADACGQELSCRSGSAAAILTGGWVYRSSCFHFGVTCDQ